MNIKKNAKKWKEMKWKFKWIMNMKENISRDEDENVNKKENWPCATSQPSSILFRLPPIDFSVHSLPLIT